MAYANFCEGARIMPRMGSERRVGLARVLSKMGYCSRSQAAELVRAGRVKLNGAMRCDPETPVRMDCDRVEVDGRRVGEAQKIYLVLNKPRGLITTASDEKGRATIYECLRQELPWVGPVGRLDKASEGLLLLTNDSEWAARIGDPESHLPKTYHVQIATLPTPEIVDALTRGVRVPELGVLRAHKAWILRQGERNAWLGIVLDEGKNRQIRRMLEGLGIEVLRLVRVAIGPVELGDLPKGAYRKLSAEEKAALDPALEK